MRNNISYKTLLKEATKLKVFLAIVFVASISLLGYTLASNTYAADYTITLNKNGYIYNGNTNNTVAISVTSASNKNNSIGKALLVSSGSQSFAGWYTSSSGGTQVFDSNGSATTNGGYWLESSGYSNYTSSKQITSSFSDDGFSGTTDSGGYAIISNFTSIMEYWEDMIDVPVISIAGSPVGTNFGWEIYEAYTENSTKPTGQYTTADGKYTAWAERHPNNNQIWIYIKSAEYNVWNYSGNLTLYAQFSDDIAKGTYDGVDWRITGSGDLILGKTGYTQTFSNKAERKKENYPWYFYSEQITTVSFAGSVNGYGDMSLMFYHCTNLESINFTNFNTSNVTKMGYMFYGCSSLTSLDLSGFNTSNVTDMYDMFANCSSLTSINLSSFNTSNVTSMSSMFQGCSSLLSLNLSNFNTSQVTNMGQMFYNCSSLISLNISGFNTSNVTSMSRMFYTTTNLRVLKLGTNFSFLDATSAYLRNNWRRDGDNTTYTYSELMSSYNGSTMAGAYRRPYTVTFNPQGGSFQGTTSTSTKILTHDSYVNSVLNETPTRSGYTFGGWYDATSNGNAAWDGNNKGVSGTYWNVSSASNYSWTCYTNYNPSDHSSVNTTLDSTTNIATAHFDNAASMMNYWESQGYGRIVFRYSQNVAVTFDKDGLGEELWDNWDDGLSTYTTNVYLSGNGNYIAWAYFNKSNDYIDIYITPAITYKYNNTRTVYAKWTKAASSLTKSVSPTSYVYDGSTHCPTPTVKDGSTTLTSNTHYTYSCSTTSTVGSKTLTITGSNTYNSTTKAYYTGSSSVTYYINNATLTFDATSNGGTGGGTRYTKTGVSVVYTTIRGTTTTTIPTASKNNADFLGWYTASSGGTKVLNANGSFAGSVSGYTNGTNWTTTENKVLYAQYQSHEHTITFDPQGGTFQGTTGTSTKTVTEGLDTNSSVGTPTRSGYSFGGWYLNDNYELWTFETVDHNIEFYLLDSSGNPVEDATIKLYYHGYSGDTYMGECTTDEDGHADNPTMIPQSEFGYIQLLYGNALSVSIEIDGWESDSYIAIDNDEETTPVYIPGSIHTPLTQIYDSVGNAVNGAYWHDENISYELTTGSFGSINDSYANPVAGANIYGDSSLSTVWGYTSSNGNIQPQGQAGGINLTNLYNNGGTLYIEIGDNTYSVDVEAGSLSNPQTYKVGYLASGLTIYTGATGDGLNGSVTNSSGVAIGSQSLSSIVSFWRIASYAANIWIGDVDDDYKLDFSGLTTDIINLYDEYYGGTGDYRTDSYTTPNGEYTVFGVYRAQDDTIRIIVQVEPYMIWQHNSDITVSAKWNKTISQLTTSVSPTSYIYDGIAHFPVLTVSDGATNLTNHTDYTYTVSPNSSTVGQKLVAITGKNIYNPTTKAYYTGTKSSTYYYINNATLTFNANGGSGGGTVYTRTGVNSVYSGIRDSTTTSLPTATKSGHNLLGWYTSTTGGEKVLNANGTFAGSVSGYTNGTNWTVIENKTLYARYDNIITFDPDGGTFQNTTNLSTLQVAYNETLNNETDIPTKSGYKFIGWYDGDDGVIVKYSLDIEYNENDNVLTFLVYEEGNFPGTHSASSDNFYVYVGDEELVLSGGSVTISKSNDDYYYDFILSNLLSGTTVTLKKASNSLYGRAYVSEIEPADGLLGRNLLDFYLSDNNRVYDENGKSLDGSYWNGYFELEIETNYPGSTSTLTLTHELSTKVPSAIIYDENYNDIGAIVDGELVYTDSAFATAVNDVASENTPLMKMYVEIDNYTYECYLASIGSNKIYSAFLGTQDENAYAINDDLTVIAYYEPEIYQITLNKQGGSNGTDNIYEKYATGYYLNSVATTQMTTSTNGITIPTKTGYTFDGYYTSATGGTQYIDATGKLTSSASSTNFSANGTLYAHWSRGLLSIEEEVKGNQADTSKEFSFTINVKDTSGNNISGTYAYTGSKSGNLTFSSGNATFTLHHDQYIEMYFPTGYTYTITQTNTGSYTLTKTNDTGTLDSDKTATFTDTLSSAVPTGLFSKLLPYLLLILFSFLFIIVIIVLYKKKKREKKGET